MGYSRTGSSARQLETFMIKRIALSLAAAALAATAVVGASSAASAASTSQAMGPVSTHGVAWE